MPDKPMGGSAGLRDRRNIELMHARRVRKYDGHGNSDELNDLDALGRGS